MKPFPDKSEMHSIQVDAFWSKVAVSSNVSECWEWQGAVTANGYGNVRINKRYLGAHRVAFLLANSTLPHGFMVCHICDNTKCCNPNHLMLGTAKSNSADMVLKNRKAKRHPANSGEKNALAKLNDQAVLEIRRLYKETEITQKELARRYGVSPPAISSVLLNKTWRHLSG